MVEMLEVDIIAIIIASILGIVLHALGILPEQFIITPIPLAFRQGSKARMSFF